MKAGIEMGAEALEKILESKFGPLLVKLHEESPERFAAVVAAINLVFSELKPLVEKTATNLDDAILDALKGAVDEVLEQIGGTSKADGDEEPPADETDPDEHHGNP